MKSQVIRSRSGASAIEYGLLAALLSIAAVIAIGLTGGNLTAIFGGVGNALQSISSGSNGSSTGSSSSSDLFGKFMTVNDADLVGNEACLETGSGTTTALQATDGTDVTVGQNCSVPRTQSELQSNVESGGDSFSPNELFFFNPTAGGAITVPNFDGPGTGFTIPAGGTVEVDAAVPSFQVLPSPTSPEAVSAVTAACATIDGSLSGGVCTGKKASLLTSSEFGSMLVNGAT